MKIIPSLGRRVSGLILSKLINWREVMNLLKIKKFRALFENQQLYLKMILFSHIQINKTINIMLQKFNLKTFKTKKEIIKKIH